MADYNLINRMVTEREAAIYRARAINNGDPVGIIDPAVDAVWAKLHSDSDAPDPYYSYFYTGQDIKVHIAELGDDPKYGEMPIHTLQFSVEQQKQPVYGYASYTYDAVMRGTRVINGNFTLITRYPGYMRDCLKAAAHKRAIRQRTKLQDNYPTNRGLTDDDANIEKYWSKHIDIGLIDYNEWSVHPPFSLVVTYGIQDTSVTLDEYSKQFNPYAKDNALFADHNQRLVEGDQYVGSKFVLDACELQGMRTGYSPDGALIVEMYEFFGRDIIVPPPNNRVGPTERSTLNSGRLR